MVQICVGSGGKVKLSSMRNQVKAVFEDSRIAWRTHSFLCGTERLEVKCEGSTLQALQDGDWQIGEDYKLRLEAMWLKAICLRQLGVARGLLPLSRVGLVVQKGLFHPQCHAPLTLWLCVSTECNGLVLVLILELQWDWQRALILASDFIPAFCYSFHDPGLRAIFQQFRFVYIQPVSLEQECGSSAIFLRLFCCAQKVLRACGIAVLQVWCHNTCASGLCVLYLACGRRLGCAGCGSAWAFPLEVNNLTNIFRMGWNHQLDIMNFHGKLAG